MAPGASVSHGSETESRAVALAHADVELTVALIGKTRKQLRLLARELAAVRARLIATARLLANEGKAP